MSLSRCTCDPPSGAEHANWCPLHEPDLTSALDRALAEIQDTVENPERICSLSYEEARAVFVELRALRAKDEAAAAVARWWDGTVYDTTNENPLWNALDELARVHREGP